MYTIGTQGHAHSNDYVSSYHVSASDDGVYWRSVYTDEKNANKEVHLSFVDNI